MLPSQVINPCISNQREMIAKKEGKFHPISTTSNNAIPCEARQCIWIQDPTSKKWNPGSIKEKATELNSYLVELNGAEYRRNTNFIKPRASTEVHFSTSEASASGPATIQTSSVDAIPTEHTSITATSDRKTSTTTPAEQYDGPARVSSRSNKGIAPRRYGFEE